MPWVKKNLVFLITCVVSLLLLGGAGYYSYSKMGEDETVTAELEEVVSKYQELLKKPVNPGNAKIDNIKILKEESARIKEFTSDVKAYLSGPELPTNINNAEFRVLLDTAVTDMRRKTTNVGMTLPTKDAKDYWFSFGNHKVAVDFKEAEFLAAQLGDVHAIVEVLVDAKVHGIIAMKREPQPSEGSGSDFLLDRKAKTNDWAILSPYEITFTGFSGEVSRVLEGLANAKQCFIVRAVGVDKAPAVAGQAQAPVTPMPMAAPMNPMASRYGALMGGRGMMPSMPPPGAGAPPPQRGTIRLLNENRLKVTLQIDSVRLKNRKKS